MNNKNNFETGFLLQRVTGVEAAAKVVQLASGYSHPHSVLGKESAEEYVKSLLSGRREHLKCPDTDGWYTGADDGEVYAACHLSIYGVGNGKGHTLWKIRHPLLRDGADDIYLIELFRRLCRVAFQARPGSAKIVIFVGQQETEVQLAARGAGFKEEACLRDYYRLGEYCFIYGKTMIGPG
jgi:hypothetical protein